MAWSSKASTLPPASLKLLVSPVRLMAAFMWKVVQQDSSVMHYEKLLDFISLATEMVPELLSPSLKIQLMLGLRAKLVLELCRGDGVANLKSIQTHLDKIHTCCVELSACDQMETDNILKTSYSNFASLVQDILNIPSEKEVFFQTYFSKHYGPVYSKRIQQLVSVFLSRLEELMPTPNLDQTTVWLSGTSASEEFKHHLTEPLALKTLLLHHRELGTLSSVCPSSEDETILSALSFTNPANEFSEADDDDDDDDDEVSNEVSLALEDLDEDSSQCLTDSDDLGEWLPKKKSDLFPRLFISSKGPDTPPIPTKVRACVQKAASIQKKKSEKKGRSKTLQKSQDLKVKSSNQNLNINTQSKGVGEDTEKEKKEDNIKKKRCRKKKEPTGEDKRFLSARVMKKEVPEEDTKCPTCEKVFKHPNQLKTHLKLHSFRYSCIECDKGFTSYSGYSYHQKIHKKGRIFMCNQCNKAFPSKYALKQHTLLHDGPSNFCKICKKNFSKNGYIRHMQMHKGERNFLCTTCGKAFLSSGELQLHNRTHTGELPYTCVHCGKGFSCKAHLVVHTRSHTGDRPYLCTECPKRFLTLNCLKRHTLSHNGVKPFKCSQCDKEFSQVGNMRRHMATHKLDM